MDGWTNGQIYDSGCNPYIYIQIDHSTGIQESFSTSPAGHLFFFDPGAQSQKELATRAEAIAAKPSGDVNIAMEDGHRNT